MVHWRKALPLGLLCLAVPGAVYGQEDLRGVGVLDRLRPAYDPDGVRLGAFEIKTGVKVSETYTDNVFASETNKKSDIITSVAPDITVTSTWSRHQLRLRGSLDTRFHAQESDENATDWALGADGRIDITRNTTLALDAGYRREHEERGDGCGLQVLPLLARFAASSATLPIVRPRRSSARMQPTAHTSMAVV